jgi:hypothetical protein
MYLDDLTVNRPCGLSEESVLDKHPEWVQFFYDRCCGL